MDVPQGETLEMLQEAARSVDCELSEFAIKRRVRSGLLPRPHQQHVQGKRGSLARYPPGTSAQLRALCKLERKHGTRNAKLIGMIMLVHGYDVDVKYLKAPLESALSFMAKLRWASKNNHLHKVVRFVGSHRLNLPIIGGVLRRVRDSLDTWVAIMAEVCLGKFRGVESRNSNDKKESELDQLVLGRSINIVPAKNKKDDLQKKVGFKILASEFENQLINLSASFEKLRLDRFFDDYAWNTILESARELFHLLGYFYCVDSQKRLVEGESHEVFQIPADLARTRNVILIGASIIIWSQCRLSPEVRDGSVKYLATIGYYK